MTCPRCQDSWIFLDRIGEAANMQLLWVAMVPKEFDPGGRSDGFNSSNGTMTPIMDGLRKTAMVGGTRR